MNARSPEVSRDTTLYVTRRTVMADGHVYPTANISHFGPGSIPIFVMPLALILLLGLIWTSVAMASMADSDLIAPAWVLFLALAAAVGWKVVNPKREGLLITMNSGQSRIFPTQDKSGTQRVGAILRELMEHVENFDGQQVITVNDHSVTVTGGSFTGQNVLAPIEGSVSNHG